jgi:raffinose/stachyose/melibiose transport system permease protein
MKNSRGVAVGGAAIVLTAVFFLVPFAFIFLIASKGRTEANLLQFSGHHTLSCWTTWFRPSPPVTI